MLQAIHLLEKHPDKINWYDLAGNPNLLQAIHILEEYPNKIDVRALARNPQALELLGTEFERLPLGYLSCNPNAIHLLEQNLNRTNWDGSSSISWYGLSTNPNAIHILENNIDKINWQYLTYNPNALQILEKHPDKINWYGLSKNLDKSLRNTSFRKKS